jgi:hypothetical protein
MIDEREDVGEAEQIGHQQDQEDDQYRTDHHADRALPRGQLIQLSGDLPHLRIRQGRDPRRRLGRVDAEATICWRTSARSRNASTRSRSVAPLSAST